MNNHRCERCERLLDTDKVVWLELSNTDGKYYPIAIPTGHMSQGCFPFGAKCAESQIIEDGTKPQDTDHIKFYLNRIIDAAYEECNDIGADAQEGGSARMSDLPQWAKDALEIEGYLKNK